MFFKKICFVLAIVVVADIGIGALLKHYYYRMPYGEQARTTYAADSSWQDMLILGSSRASHHYISDTFSAHLGISCYNAGKDKEGLMYSLAMYKMILKRHAPHYVILDINPSAFTASEYKGDLLSVLLPYYKDHPEIRPIVNYKSQWEPVKTFSSLYCYNSLLLQIIFNNVSRKRDAGAVNGYVPLNRNFTPSFDTASYLKGTLEEPLDTVLQNAFSELIRLSAANASKLIMVVSPCHFSFPETSAAVTQVAAICKQEKLPFFDYSSDPQFVSNKDLFSDQFHLNHRGAIIFSEKLCAAILGRDIIQNPSSFHP